MGSDVRGELRLFERIYGALLYLYPKEFRQAHGRPMRLTFRAACRAAYRRTGAGGLGRLGLALSVAGGAGVIVSVMVSVLLGGAAPVEATGGPLGRPL
jgi:hypothetical protein